MKTITEIENSNATFSIGLALSDGWKLVSKNLGFYILGGIVATAISFVTGLVPFIGSIANNIIVSPCLMSGAIYVTWRISNNIAWTEFGDMFKGFNFLTPIALSSLIQVAATVLLTVLFFFGLIPQFIELLRLSQGTGAYSNRDEIEIVLQSFLNMKTLLLFLGYMLSLLFITALWVFKNHFIVIYNMQAWPALELSRKVVTKNLLPVVGLLFLLFVILIVSAIPCGIGLLFTLPLSIGATYSAFAQITGADHANEIDNNMFDFIEDEPKV